ncbi:MAG: signal peptide peptidase SppA [Treponema sp.]|nr:signal peptide peptidase SppA [Treponema sp.]
MKKTVKSGIIVFILLIIGVGIYSVYNILFPKSNNEYSERNMSYRIAENSRNYDINTAKNYRNEFIAALYIEGTIQAENYYYSQKWILSNIESLKNNSKNVALAIFINTPGGAVYQADEVYLALEDYRTSGKPVYVYQGPMAASGGYYISCAANKIYANRNTLTGCIGVIMAESYDLTGLFNKLGIKSTTIYSGKNKNMMNYNEPFTAEQKAIMQSICDECYDQFVTIVSNSRKIKYDTVCKLADGRLYTAKQALEHRLIDGIGSWEDMLCDLAENELEKPGIKVQTYKKPKKRQSIFDIMTGNAKEIEKAKTAAALGVPSDVIDSMNNRSLMPMYLAPQN